ncbi:MAG: hypothetical protein Q7S74_00765 [Nanoarchaeota archaeon]|nr:hypothetical protein [Nanoarchaeota archaeon]
MKERVKLYSILLIFLGIIFLSGIVSAAPYYGSSYGGTSNIIRGVEQGMAFIVGDVAPAGGLASGEIVMIKFLVFILLFAIVHSVIKRAPNFGDNKAVVLIISIIVPLIGVRYLTTADIINFIWLPYGTLAVFISAILPFVIGFFFIEGMDSTVIRKVGWTAFLVIFAGLGYMRWDELANSGPYGYNLGWLYIIIAIISGVLLLFDKEVRVRRFMSSLHSADEVNKRAEAARLTTLIDEDERLLAQTSDRASREALKHRIRIRKDTRKDVLRS